jgi:hypothetical protein
MSSSKRCCKYFISAGYLILSTASFSLAKTAPGLRRPINPPSNLIILVKIYGRYPPKLGYLLRRG